MHPWAVLLPSKVDPCERTPRVFVIKIPCLLGIGDKEIEHGRGAARLRQGYPQLCSGFYIY